MWIKGHCVSNHDDLMQGSKWPELFAPNIRKGDRVQNLSNTKKAYVCLITHSVTTTAPPYEQQPCEGIQEPYIIVELHQMNPFLHT